jgi:sugar phosphate isomerase/epimerase
MRFSFVVSGGLGYHIPELFQNDSSFAEFQKALKLLKEQGFTGVELNLGFDEEQVLSRIGDAVRQGGLRLAAVGTGLIYRERGFSFTNPDSAKRERASAIVKELIRFASREHAIVVIGMVRGGPLERGDIMKLLRQSLVECDKTATEHKVRIALEAINRYETSLLNTASDVAEMIEHGRLNSTGILLDTFHMNIEEASIETTIRKYHARVAHFHIADSDRWPPGHGHLKVEDQLTLLNESGYDGWVSAETLPKPDNAEAVKKTAHFLRTHNFLQAT